MKIALPRLFKVINLSHKGNIFEYLENSGSIFEKGYVDELKKSRKDELNLRIRSIFLSQLYII